jgi:colanic acid biosynthesis protein WcaH|tara:strand:- start:4029 stop:4556 length:528 start_codon:yes stop_codon:yes gene_type:complete
MFLSVKKALDFLEKKIKTYRISNPNMGLPEEIFFFASRHTPIVNVDLLVQDSDGRTLLSWRDNYEWEGTGWHIPGGVVRHKESFEDRIQQVAMSELGTEVTFDEEPIAIEEIIQEHETRSHFISVLFRCYVDDGYVPANKGLADNDAGFLSWHDQAPTALLRCQEIYREHINGQT